MPETALLSPMHRTLPEWRIGRGWSPAELARRLADLRQQMVTAAPDLGGARHHSEAVVFREPPGPPLADGAFARGCELVRRYEFSDPRIVTGHFDRGAGLQGRHMLLEIKVLGLRYLCGVVVGAVADRREADRSLFGFRYDTLASHIEAGAEWFLLTKDHASGEVRFRIEALWREGQLPNWWSRAGFKLLAPRYQRAWHRLAYLRLRAALQARGLPALPPRTSPAARGAADARAAHPGGDPRMRMTTTTTAIGLAGVAGLRSMLPLALLSARLTRTRPPAAPFGLLARPRVSQALALAAAGELLVDKLPFVPARTAPLPLAGRMAAGALVAVAASEVGRTPSASSSSRPGFARSWLLPALAGAAAALATTLAGHRFRTAGANRNVPDLPLALVEDAVGLLAARWLLARL
jgi:uncharacterized membrane protein/uncharacterized protein (UPF0548 family)